jgi:hypothetical protein
MTLDLSLIEHLQVQNASPPIGCLIELFYYHWLLLKVVLQLKTYCVLLGFTNWLSHVHF